MAMAPAGGTGAEISAVGGEDAAEVGVGLQGGDQAVGAEGGDAGADPQQALVFADACHTSQASPISNSGASANSGREGATVAAGTAAGIRVAVVQVGRGGAFPRSVSSRGGCAADGAV